MQRTLLTAVVVTFWAGLYVYVPVLSPHAADLGADLGMIGLVVGAYGITQLLLRIPTGWLSDRLRQRKGFVTAGFAIAAVSALVMAWAPTPWLLFAGRGLSGLAATMWVALSVLLASSFPPDRAVAAMALAGFANNLGQIAGTISGGWIAEQWSMQAPFLVAAAVASLGLLLMLPVREPQVETVGPVGLVALTEVLSDRRLLLVSGLAALQQYTVWVTIFGFTPLHAVALGATASHLGLLTVAGLAAQALATLTTSRLADRFGGPSVLSLGFLIVMGATAAIPFTTSLAALFAVQVLGGVGRALTFPLLMGLSIKAVPSARRAMAMGVYQSVYALGMSLGPVLAGAIGQVLGLRGLFLSTALVALIALAIVQGARPLLAVAAAPVRRIS